MSNDQEEQDTDTNLADLDITNENDLLHGFWQSLLPIPSSNPITSPDFPPPASNAINSNLMPNHSAESMQLDPHLQDQLDQLLSQGGNHPNAPSTSHLPTNPPSYSTHHPGSPYQPNFDSSSSLQQVLPTSNRSPFFSRAPSSPQRYHPYPPPVRSDSQSRTSLDLHQSHQSQSTNYGYLQRPSNANQKTPSRSVDGGQPHSDDLPPTPDTPSGTLPHQSQMYGSPMANGGILDRQIYQGFPSPQSNSSPQKQTIPPGFGPSQTLSSTNAHWLHQDQDDLSGGPSRRAGHRGEEQSMSGLGLHLGKAVSPAPPSLSEFQSEIHAQVGSGSRPPPSLLNSNFRTGMHGFGSGAFDSSSTSNSIGYSSGHSSHSNSNSNANDDPLSNSNPSTFIPSSMPASGFPSSPAPLISHPGGSAPPPQFGAQSSSAVPNAPIPKGVDSASGQKKRSNRPRNTACLACKASKMKCEEVGTSNRCRRCENAGMTCERPERSPFQQKKNKTSGVQIVAGSNESWLHSQGSAGSQLGNEMEVGAVSNQQQSIGAPSINNQQQQSNLAPIKATPDQQTSLSASRANSTQTTRNGSGRDGRSGQEITNHQPLSTSIPGQSLSSTLTIPSLSAPRVTPQVAIVIPDHGTIAGGTLVSISGSRLGDRGLRCYFGGSAALILQKDSNLMILRSPPSPSGSSGPVVISFKEEMGNGQPRDLEEFEGNDNKSFTYVDNIHQASMNLALRLVDLELGGEGENPKAFVDRIIKSAHSTSISAASAPSGSGDDPSSTPSDSAAQSTQNVAPSLEAELLNLLSLSKIASADQSKPSISSPGSSPIPLLLPTRGEGHTLLHLCVISGLSNVVETLLDRGVTSLVEAVDDNGNTALHFAALYNRGPIARSLLAHGASNGSTNVQGQIPFQLASDRNGEAAREMMIVGSSTSWVAEIMETEFYKSTGLINLAKNASATARTISKLLGGDVWRIEKFGSGQSQILIDIQIDTVSARCLLELSRAVKLSLKIPNTNARESGGMPTELKDAIFQALIEDTTWTRIRAGNILRREHYKRAGAIIRAIHHLDYEWGRCLDCISHQRDCDQRRVCGHCQELGTICFHPGQAPERIEPQPSPTASNLPTEDYVEQLKSILSPQEENQEEQVETAIGAKKDSVQITSAPQLVLPSNPKSLKLEYIGRIACSSCYLYCGSSSECDHPNYGWEANLDHQLTHTPIHPYRCLGKRCSHSFRTRSELNDHIKTCICSKESKDEDSQTQRAETINEATQIYDILSFQLHDCAINKKALFSSNQMERLSTLTGSNSPASSKRARKAYTPPQLDSSFSTLIEIPDRSKPSLFFPENYSPSQSKPRLLPQPAFFRSTSSASSGGKRAYSTPNSYPLNASLSSFTSKVEDLDKMVEELNKLDISKQLDQLKEETKNSVQVSVPFLLCSNCKQLPTYEEFFKLHQKWLEERGKKISTSDLKDVAMDCDASTSQNASTSRAASTSKNASTSKRKISKNKAPEPSNQSDDLISADEQD